MPSGPGQTLDGCDRAALGLNRERQAGENPLPVHIHRARAALALIAALLGAGQVQVLPQGIEQGHAGLQGQGPLLPVDIQCHWPHTRHERSPFGDVGPRS